MIDEDEAANASKVSVNTGRELKHQRRAISHRAGNIGQDEKVSVPRAARAKAQVGQCAAMLQGGADGAAEIDPAAWRAVKPAAQSHTETARERRQGVARGLVVEVGIRGEGHPPRVAKLSLAARVHSELAGFDA